MKKRILMFMLVFVLLFSFLPTPEPAAAQDVPITNIPRNIYVDASNTSDGDGSINNPFRSLVDAGKAASGGDTIIVADGVYHGTVTLPSGTSDFPTILRAAPGAKPVLTPTVEFNGNWSNYEGNIYVADVGDLGYYQWWRCSDCGSSSYRDYQ